MSHEGTMPSKAPGVDPGADRVRAELLLQVQHSCAALMDRGRGLETTHLARLAPLVASFASGGEPPTWDPPAVDEYVARAAEPARAVLLDELCAALQGVEERAAELPLLTLAQLAPRLAAFAGPPRPAGVTYEP